VQLAFSPEQDDLRRIARAFLERNPSPSLEQLAELGWVGMLRGGEHSFLDAAVVFEELGRVAYDGPFVRGEVGDAQAPTLAAAALEAVGVGTRAVELAVVHAREREQFGRKIGSFQAVAHSIVDAYVAVELGRSLAYWAAWCVAVDDDGAELAALAAKGHAAEAAVEACERSMQVHGGIGFTWEHPLHRCYERALALEAAHGYGRRQRAEVADLLLRP
jgi:alkylation response protein AidB-like acyl-CoA dehydrogenase